jgi:hypothetical protein
MMRGERWRTGWFFVVAFAVLYAGVAGAARVVPAGGKPTAAPAGATGVSRVQTIDNQRRVDVNQLNMFVTNFGSFAFDLATGNAGLYFPKGVNKTAIFAGGLWIGALVGGQPYATIAEFGQEYVPGPMLGTSFSPDSPNYKVYKVARYRGNAADTAHVERTAEELAADPTADRLVHHSWSEYVLGAGPSGAPTEVVRLPVTITSDPVDSMDVVAPRVLGDQMLWCIYNDADPSKHEENAGGTPPLGLEIEQAVFGFDFTGSLGQAVFIRYVIRNKGGNTLDDMYLALWADPDLGGFTDDLVGCDVPLSLGYCYNATNTDQLYGRAPPAVGYDFLQGPLDILGAELGLTSFNKYINGTDPSAPDESYNYMQGLLPDGTDVVDPTNGQVTKFFHPGDPATRVGWLDSNPADRRYMMSSGPFRMAPGDTQVVVGAVLIGQGSDRLSSIEALKFNDQFVQLAFDEGFQLPSAPSQPVVDVAVDHGTINLCWDSRSRVDYNEPGYTFEGYIVYQGESVAGPWRRLGVFDEVNSVTTIRDTVFDLETGRTITDFPVAFGTNAGVRFCYTATEDEIRGGNLKDGTEYFFAVTSYAYGPAERLNMLENPQQPIRVIPQRSASGTDLATASSSDVEYVQKTPFPAFKQTTTVVDPVVVTPEETTGHIYKVTFEPLVPPVTMQVGQDTATVKYTWSLWDSTALATNPSAQPLLTGQVNQRGDDDYRVVDGIQMDVFGAYFPQLQSVTYLNNNEAHRRALTGVLWSGNDNWFFQGAGYAHTFNQGFGYGSALDPLNPAMQDSFVTVEVRFGTSSTDTQRVYRYLRKHVDDTGDPPAGGRGYHYGGFHTQPFTVWDTENNIQLDAFFIEITDAAADGTILPPASQRATFDSTWAPSIDGDGAREYLWLVKSAYTPAPKAEYTQDAVPIGGSIPQAPMLYTLWARTRAAEDVVDSGDLIRFTWAVPSLDNDIFVFSTSPLVQNNTARQAANMNQVRAVPNPYYNRSRYELSQFQRVVRFTNLPEQATIRIYNIAGDLVRTLRKTDAGSSLITWDLLTENQLPVASGVYVFHVEAPGGATTIGRLVIFMEVERLNSL